MDFLQATGAPVLVKYGQDTLRVPKFEMDDIVELGNMILKGRVDAQTNGMNPAERNQFLQMYPPLSPDMVEIKRYIRTPEGMRYVAQRCLLKASLLQKTGERGLLGDEIDRILKRGPSLLGPFAWTLADLEEKPLAPITPENPEGNSSTSSGTPASNA